MARKLMTGTVVSDISDKTIVVRVDRRRRHALYSKSYTVSKKWTVHDEKNEARVGDKVRINETRPISKTKSWALESIVSRSPDVSTSPSVTTEKVSKK
jgi:small subunit ribosomal protein S17